MNVTRSGRGIRTLTTGMERYMEALHGTHRYCSNARRNSLLLVWNTYYGCSTSMYSMEYSTILVHKIATSR